LVKGTFTLVPGGPAVVAEGQRLPEGDLFDDDDPDRGLRYATDLVPVKPGADLLLVGHCHTPGGEPLPVCRFAFGVGDHRRTLAAVGNRYWKRTLGIARMTEPEPFTSMEIGWTHAYGGPGNEWNPVGRGNGKGAVEAGMEGHPLPNIEDPHNAIGSPRNEPHPAGFGPVHREWQPRAGKTGSYKGEWLKKRWPALPRDFDWTNFNAAPEEMQLAGYLRGDEPLFFENLHPDRPRYDAQLPGTRVRLFLDRGDAEPFAFEEVVLHLDTLWVDMDEEELVLIWRGTTDIRDEETSDVARVTILEESVADSPADLAACRRRRDELLAAESPPEEVTPSVAEQIAASDEQIKQLFLAEGIDVDQVFNDLPEPDPEQDKEAIRAFCTENDLDEAEFKEFLDSNTRERVQERHALGEGFDGESMRALDLSALDLTGVKAPGVDFTGVSLAGTTLADADLSGANFLGANLRGADLTGATLTGALLLQADLNGANLEGAVLDRAQLREATLNATRLAGATGEATSFAATRLQEAIFDEATLTGCDFTDAQLDGTHFTSAHLAQCDFSGATGSGATFAGSDLTGGRFGAGTDLSGGDFSRIHAPDSVWDQATLTGVRFPAAQLTGALFMTARLDEADFTLARMRGARFDRANLRGARLCQADVCQGSFEGADLTAADLRESSLFECEFFNATIRDTVRQGADLSATKLD